MKHLVTGGSGFLGNLIAKRLLVNGEDVKILDVLDDSSRPKEIEFFHGSILDRNLVGKAMKGVDIVHHNAALVPLTKSGSKFWDINVIGSQIAAEEAAKAKVKSFIHMSSSSIFGVPEFCPITNKTPVNPFDIYGKSKLAGELKVKEICKEHKIPLIVIRPRTILGEGRLGIFKILFDWIKDNANIYVIGNGNIDFQFVHALDLMDFYMLALKLQQPGVYNVGTDSFNTLRKDLEDLITYANSKSKVKSLPIGLTIGTLKLLDWLKLSPLAPWHYLSYHKAFHFDVTPLLDMGWKPKYSNNKMLKESYNSFLNTDYEKNQSKQSIHRTPIKENILWILKKIS